MSPAGTSVSGPMWRKSSVMKLWQKRITSASLQRLPGVWGLCFGLKAALAAAHRERRERVLEDLLEGEELEDGEVDRRVEAQASLVGTDRAVLLDAVAAVDADLARVVHPRNAEYNNALRLDDALENRVLFILRIRLEDRVKREEHFLGGLDELGFVRVLRLEILQDAVNVFAHFNLRFLS